MPCISENSNQWKTILRFSNLDVIYMADIENSWFKFLHRIPVWIGWMCRLSFIGLFNKINKIAVLLFSFILFFTVALNCSVTDLATLSTFPIALHSTICRIKRISMNYICILYSQVLLKDCIINFDYWVCLLSAKRQLLLLTILILIQPKQN